ncbi:MAG: EAL domain-containing response regulator [Alphaproteobacteria bacterium]
MAPKRLVVLDDDLAFGRVVSRAAESIGFVTVATDDPAVFRKEIRTHKVAAIVLDLHMPSFDGIEMLRELAGTAFGSPVLLASGVAPKVLETAHHLGVEYGLKMAGVINKPLRINELRELLSRLPEPFEDLNGEALIAGVNAGEFVLHYQPKLNLKSKSIVGVEALVRWQHRSLGMLSPEKFIGLAESSNAINNLTDWVVDSGIAQAGAWRRDALELELAVNVSAKTLGNLGLPDRLTALCAKHAVPTESITLELTETASAQDPLRMLDILTRFRIKGFKLAIDDFGTGYSSLAQLRKLPFSEMKIDKSFVMNMQRSRDSAIIATAVINLAHSLEMHAVAEGVESQEALDILIERGCDMAQGYHISKPLPPEGIPDFMRFRSRAL